MVNVFREQLPEIYLPALMETSAPGPETALAQALLRATRSTKPAVWVDCSAGRPLAHVNEAMRAQLTGPRSGSPTILPALLDVDRAAYVSAA